MDPRKIFSSFFLPISNTYASNTTVVFLVLFFVILGFILRVTFLDWGLPYIYHADEPTNLSIVQGMIRKGDFNPWWFEYPSFLWYINLPGQYLVKWWDGALSPFTMQSMGNGFTEQSWAFQVARLTTLLFGLAILPLLIIWARIISVGVAGLLVLSVVFCFDPFLVRHSTYIAPDIFATFFATGALLFASLIVLRGNHSNYIAAGIMAGFAASSKYNAGLVAIAIPAAHVLRHGLTVAKLRPLILATGTTVFVFLMSSPFIVVHPRFAAGHIIFQVLHYGKMGHPGFEGHSLATNAGWMVDNFGFAGLLAIAVAFSSRWRVLFPTILFIVAYFLLLSVQRVHFDRNLLPLIPAMVLLVGTGVDTIAQTAARAWPNARLATGLISTVFALALFVKPATTTMDEVTQYVSDPRAAARVWVNALLPNTPVRVVAVEPYAPYVTQQSRTVEGLGYHFLLAMPPDTLSRFSYLVLSKQGSGRFLHGPYDVERANLAALTARSCEHHEFPANSAEPDYSIFVLSCN